MTEIPAGWQAILDVMFSYANKRTAQLHNKKLAHYTTADNALSIIRGEQIWLRNAAVMNDFSEMVHGARCVNAALSSATGDRFQAAINGYYPDLWTQIELALSQSDDTIRLHTYMTSLCEHTSDDVLGRLSMWRAYGGNASGVALVLNTEFVENSGSYLPVYPSPVFYGNESGLTAQLQNLCERIETNQVDMTKGGSGFLFNTVLRALMFAKMSCKHIGFQEEEEWRLIHLPDLGEDHPFVPGVPESIRGIPQIVYKLPLKSDPQLGNISLASLIHRVIIGPTLYPQQVAEAITYALKEKNVPNAAEKVVISDIPLRQWG